MFSGLLADIAPLKESRDFRFVFASQLVSAVGRQFTVVAIPYQVFVITRSSLAVGLIGLTEVVPLVVFSLVAGTLADALDRRKVLLVTQICMATTSAGLALNAMAHHAHLWLIYVLAGLGAGLVGVDLPTRNAVIPKLVRGEVFPAAATLNQLVWNLGVVAGPALAGLLLQVSFSLPFGLDASSWCLSFLALLALHPLPPEGGGRRAGLESFREGLVYVKGRLVLIGTFVIDLDAMIFGMPSALFPAFGTEVFRGGSVAVGLLYAAPGFGALVAALFAGWVGRVNRQGLAVVIAVLIWGVAVVGFGLATVLWAALLLLAVAGGADMVSAVFRNAILQLSVPDRLRGRMSSLHAAVVASGPRLGDLESGVVARFSSPRFSAVFGGAACIAGALIIIRLIPDLAKFRMERRGGEGERSGGQGE